MIKQNVLLLFFIGTFSSAVLAMENEIKFALSETRVQLPSAEQLSKNLKQSGFYVFAFWENPAHYEVGSGKSAGTLAKHLGGKELTLGQLSDTVGNYINRYTQDKYDEAKRQRKSMGFDVSRPGQISKIEILKYILRDEPCRYQDIINLESLLNADQRKAGL